MPRFSTTIVCPSDPPGFLEFSSRAITDGADIDFSQPIVLGLSNPFNLTGITTAWEVNKITVYFQITISCIHNYLQGAHQLYIRVLDLDSITPFRFDRIITYRFDLSLSVGSTTTSFKSSGTGTSISVSTTVLCAPFYIANNCEIFNHCEFNAVTCSDRGTCVNEMDSFTCNCDPPYFDANCEHQNFCYNRNCNERGMCTNGFDSYTCVCNAGYTGVDCEDIDECEGQSCSGNGVCMDEVNFYMCVCNAGYTGANCEVDIDECLLRR